MDTETAPAADAERREFRAVRLLYAAAILALCTVLLAAFINGRIVLIGGLNLVVVVAVLGVLTVCAVGAFFLVIAAQLAQGVLGELLCILFSFAVVLVSLALIIIVALGSMMLTDTGTRTKLATVTGYSNCLVTASNDYSGQSLKLYCGNGWIFWPDDTRLPDPQSVRAFGSHHSVETNAEGQPFLVYTDAEGDQVRVRLP